MKHNYIAYIDEAGDEGFGKLRDKTKSGGQSNWFALGACLVSDTHDRDLPKLRDEILTALKHRGKRDLHFKDLNHDQKTVACQIVSKHRLGICVILSNKVTLQDHPKKKVFKEKQHLYNYMVRFLLERLTDACANASQKRGQESCTLKIVFSRRRGTDYHAMKEYLEFLRGGKEIVTPVRSINWNVLDIPAIEVINHSKSAGLQIADVVTSAIYKAVEPNFYGNYEHSYSEILSEKFISDKKGKINCGVTIIPPLYKCPLDEKQTQFFDKFK